MKGKNMIIYCLTVHLSAESKGFMIQYIYKFLINQGS